MPLCGNAYKVSVRDYLPALIVIRGRSADNRKAPLNFSFPLEGKCHVVAKGCTRVSIPMKLTIVLLGPTSLCGDPLQGLHKAKDLGKNSK